ncbi:uncharacterized protein [Typha angustifolia]|uniref:uncharacterized protein isoform X1 n=1 Tax=Typha angustifolia TaxID=59011 RepID=UPI003C308E86
MAASDFLGGINDIRLKPRLLRSLVRDRLPGADEKHPFPNPSELSSILASIKTHGFLSEDIPDPPNEKLAEAWRSAFDAWVDRVLSLVSSAMPDKCWAGTCLLGVTIAECSTDRLAGSYSLWFERLLPIIQLPSSTYYVKVASCASFADLFTRLAGLLYLKKDTTSLAGRLVQPVLQLLNENGQVAIWEGAVDLLCVLMKFYPSSINRYYDNVEFGLSSKVMSTKCNVHISKKFARSLALLPQVRGDEDSWSLMMQKILIFIVMLLNDAFEGLEEENKRSEVMKLLVPPGKDPPPLFGGQLRYEEEPDHATRSLHGSVVPMVSTLIYCCCDMLTNPYPVQVTVPVRPLLALVGRVLLLDGSLHTALLPFTTSMHQELLCSVLPSFHMDCLDLLIAIIKGLRSQLLPHAANVVQLLREYFKRAKLPSLRVKVYSVVQLLLISMGVGMALYVAQEIMINVSADLDDGFGSGSQSLSTYSLKVVNEASLQRCSRKRKRVSSSQIQNGVNLETMAVSRKPTTPLSVKIAALNALETLLTVGGSLKLERGRSDVDLLLINVATNAFDAGWSYERQSAISEESAVSRADFQLAALRALLASLLSSSDHCGPYLSQGLELFRRGKLETGTQIAAFSAHALLALDVLIHPRALSLMDFPNAKSHTSDEGFINKVPEGTFFGSQKPYLIPTLSADLGATDDAEDAFTYLLDPGEEDQTVGSLTKNFMAGRHAGADKLKDHEEVRGTEQPLDNDDMEMPSPSIEGKENMVKLNKMENTNSAAAAAVCEDEMVHNLVTNNLSILSNKIDTSKGLDDGDFPSKSVTSAEDAIPSLNTPDFKDGSGYASKSSTAFSQAKVHDSDSESLDSLPDIVVGEPDSDSD